MKVRLIGKTRHGKNRVREHGEFWLVKGKSETLTARPGLKGPFMSLIPANGSDDWRWVAEKDDPNFEVEPVED
jgi:hypothetical protein